MVGHEVVAVVQLVEPQIVVLVVAGSSPVGHPILHKNLPPRHQYW